jgi:hypothetical protein
MEQVPKSGRRALLKKGVLGALGLATFGVLGREALNGGGSGGSRGLALTFYGANMHSFHPARVKGVLPGRGERYVSYGELLDGPGGEKVGEFYAAAFATGSPFGESDVSAASVQLQTFKLADGMLIGVAADEPRTESSTVHAIIGGTGKYAGASGTYVASLEAREHGGDGSAAFVFNIQTPGVTYA